VKGKSVASRQPLVRATNPWVAGEAESAVGSWYSDGPRDQARRRRRCLAELEFPRPTLYPRRCGRILNVCTTANSELQLERSVSLIAWTRLRRRGAGGRADVS
jgi:hypothetical protein